MRRTPSFSPNGRPPTADALTALQAVLDEVGERPLPADQLAAACGAARDAIAQPGLTGRLLAACGGADERSLPGGDVDLWLTLAAGVVSPAGEAVGTAAAGGPPEPGHDDAAEPGPAPGESDDDDTDTVSRAIGALCALEHIDWLAAVSALAKGGPGTPASAADITRYVREYCEAGPPPGPGDMLAVLPDDLAALATRTLTKRPSRSYFPTSRACGRSSAPPTRHSA